MSRTLAVFVCCFCLATSIHAEDVLFPDGIRASAMGGLVFIRKGNQTTVALGGVLTPRKIKVTTQTPEGPVVTRFVYPAVICAPLTLPLPESGPACLQVEMPDPYGILYIEGELVRCKGMVRHLESQVLPPGKAYPLRLRAAFASGDKFLIEDKQIMIRAGESATITFDGKRALAVPLPR